MKRFKVISMSLFLLACATAEAGFQQHNVAIAKYTLSAAYIPMGFDSVNKTQVTVEGIFTDTCYRVGPHKVAISGNSVTITQAAYRYDGMCLDVMVPFSQTIDLGILPVGHYEVMDGTTGKELGMLPIAPAPKKSQVTYPDDFLYAPVSDAMVLKDGSGPHVIISGAFTDDCTHFTEVRVRAANNVIQVLPITERSKGVCHKGFHPFQISKPLAVQGGHYLLHVRALSGAAVNKMVDIY